MRLFGFGKKKEKQAEPVKQHVVDALHTTDKMIIMWQGVKAPAEVIEDTIKQYELEFVPEAIAQSDDGSLSRCLDVIEALKEKQADLLVK